MIKNVIEYLEKSSLEFPERLAFEDENISITFYELKVKAQKLATSILKFTQNKQCQPIAIYMDKGVDCIVAFMATIYSGNFYIPLDVHSPFERVEKIFNKLSPKLIITEDSNISSIASCDVLLFDKIDEEIDSVALDKIFKKHIDTNPLYVMFTSGSTGTPKGVTISHKSVIDYANWLEKTFHFNKNTVFANQAPMYFDNSILDIYSTLKTGAKTVFVPEKLFMFAPKLLLFMAERQVNTIFWVPSALTLVANRKKVAIPQNLFLEKILFCGEVMPVRTLNRWKEFFPNAYYANLYGPTEITDVCSYYEIKREFVDAESLPIGYSCNNIELLIVTEENELAVQDEIGELCVRGTCLSLGYYNDKEKTDAVFVQNPLHNAYNDKVYRTGDLVKMNSNGEIIFVGRKDSQIKHMGYRIELGELEVVASSFAAIDELCSLYDPEKQHIVLLCTCQEAIKEMDILEFLEKKLPTYMLPARIFFLETMPHTPNGKVDRVCVKKNYYEKRD